MMFHKVPPSDALCYTIVLGPSERAAIEDTFAEYGRMLEILAQVAQREAVGSDIVRLQRLSYETIRARTRLPSQFVLLGIRDFAAQRSSQEQPVGLPLDEKLYAIKSPSRLTLATVQGRVALHYDVAGYLDGWRGSAPARLRSTNNAYEIRVGVRPSARPSGDGSMAYEGILSRAGRLVAGLAHAAIDKAEQSGPIPVVEQALRDIDREAGEARALLGKHTAERHRIESRRAEIAREVEDSGRRSMQPSTPVATTSPAPASSATWIWTRNVRRLMWRWPM